MTIKYLLTYLESSGQLKKLWTPGMGAQAPVIDNVAWFKLKRNFESSYDDSQRLGKWLPSASNLGNDQIPWKLRLKAYESIYDESIRLGRWLPDSSNLGQDQISWRGGLKRNYDCLYEDSKRNNTIGYLFASQAPVIDDLSWQKIKRFSESESDIGGQKYSYGSVFSAQQGPPVNVLHNLAILGVGI